ncbi:MAG: hypothetical protein R2851_05325 [Caldilineaceae bacterium]
MHADRGPAGRPRGGIYSKIQPSTLRTLDQIIAEPECGLGLSGVGTVTGMGLDCGQSPGRVGADAARLGLGGLVASTVRRTTLMALLPSSTMATTGELRSWIRLLKNGRSLCARRNAHWASSTWIIFMATIFSLPLKATDDFAHEATLHRIRFQNHKCAFHKFTSLIRWSTTFICCRIPGLSRA